MDDSRPQVNMVHLSGGGDYQIGRINVLKDPFPMNERKDRNSMEADDLHSIEVLVAPYGDLLSCMEMAKVADLIAFVVSANSLYDGCESSSIIDSFGTQALSALRSVGLPSTAVLIRDLPVDLKGKLDLKKMSTSCLASELPEDCKFYLADANDELHKFMWLFK